MGVIVKKEHELFIQRFLSELEEDNVAIFAGAGLSTASGYVNWKELLRPLASELNLDIDQESDLVAIAQFYLNENGRNRISQQLMDEIATLKVPNEIHQILARLPIRTYWTTNYDKLIEKALENSGKTPDVKYTNNHLALTKRRRDAVIYKMHGDIDHPDSAIISKDDYEGYPVTNAPYITALSGDLVSKTFLFIGFSFTDPNIDYIFSRVRVHFKEHQRQHYCISKRCSFDEYNSKKDFESASIRQQLVIQDLKRFQIKTLLVDEYSEITAILQKIERSYRRKIVFLSGSAHEFGTWNKAEVEGFLCKLGSLLINRNYKISSGIGLGIGNAFITGAIQSVYEKQGGNVGASLNMKPFPQFIEDMKERKATWTRYRHELIGSAGIALFFMGNKLRDGKIVLADGMEEEFRIAVDHGLSVIPIGSSGYKAKELWQEVVGNFDKFHPVAAVDFQAKLYALGEEAESPNHLISQILEIVDLISGG